MSVDYLSMTEEQIAIINEYCENDMKKLKQICYTVWGNKGLPNCYYDDLYDDLQEPYAKVILRIPDYIDNIKNVTWKIKMSGGDNVDDELIYF